MMYKILFLAVFIVVGAEAERKTDCQEHRERELKSKAPLPMRLIPECDKNGDYKPRQCFKDSDFCACWDKKGNPVTQPSKKVKKCDCLLQKHEVEKKVDKSAQTSPYLDNRHCLVSLSQDLRKVMEDSSKLDVSFRCGDCTFPAHSAILGARSPVFRTMLQADMLEGREGSVEIVDMDPEVLGIFLGYLYTGNLPEVLTADIALELYEAADKYQVDALRGPCGEFLAENLTLENACGIIAVADAHNDVDLKYRVVPYVLDENIPKRYDGWPKFCADYPKLAVEILNRAYHRLESMG